MPELTLGAAIDGLKKMELKLINEPKFKRHLQELKELETMAGEPLLIMVMGEFSAGKSTFINAVLGQEVTVRGATPTTAVITKICYGDRDETIVHFKDGRKKQYDHHNFVRLTAETTADKEARRLRKEMDYVEKRLNLSILKEVSIIDSPGLGAITAGHEQTTKRFMGNADAVVWLMNVQQPAKASEVNRLESLDPRLKPFVLVNQIDLIDEEEDDIDDILDDVWQKVKGHAHSVHGISAKKALEGRLSGNNADVEASNIDEFFSLLRDEVLPNRDGYRMHTLVHETATLLRHGGATLKFWSDQIESLRDFNYEIYANEQAALQSFEQALAEFARLWKEYVYDKGQEAERQYFEGVLYQYGLLGPADTKKALECFKVAAKYGESEAETAYASALESVGYYKDAFSEYQKAALQENGEAAAGLARLIEQGHGKGDAQVWYRKAAQWGFMEAHLHIDYGSDVTKKFHGLHEAALQGIPDAQVALAECYRQGIGCVRDTADVFKWQLEAAKQGLHSQFVPVAQAYRNGTGVEKDPVQEFYWLTRAADYADAESALHVALCFFYGHGVEQDCVEAFIRLQRISDNFFYGKVRKQAKMELDRLFVQGTAEIQLLIGDAVFSGKLKAFFRDSRAIDWYKRAESQGSLDGAYRKGLCLWRIYQEKNHDPKTHCGSDGFIEKVAESWRQRKNKVLYGAYISIKKAEKAGHVAAEGFLQRKFEEGIPELQYCIAQAIETEGNDLRDAFYWYLKAAEGGYAPAFTVVGEFYSTGKGGQQSWFNALSWLSKAKKEDGERGKEAYKAFVAPTYRKIKRGISVVAFVMLTFYFVGLYIGRDFAGHDFRLNQLAEHVRKAVEEKRLDQLAEHVRKAVEEKRIVAERAENEKKAQEEAEKKNRKNRENKPNVDGQKVSDDVIGGVKLGDDIKIVEQTLGKALKKTASEGNQIRCEYEQMDVAYKNGRVVGIAADDEKYSLTGRGVKAGSRLDAVINKYGKNYMLYVYENLDLYEYKFYDKKDAYILRFAVRRNDNRVKYISVRYAN